MTLKIEINVIEMRDGDRAHCAMVPLRLAHILIIFDYI